MHHLQTIKTQSKAMSTAQKPLEHRLGILNDVSCIINAVLIFIFTIIYESLECYYTKKII